MLQLFKNKDKPELELEKDVERAKQRLVKESLALIIVKKRETIFETKAPGIASLLKIIDSDPNLLGDASVADRVVGKAVAILRVYAKVEAVYAITLSRTAKQVLGKAEIRIKWMSLVDNILSSEMTGLCPFEKFFKKNWC